MPPTTLTPLRLSGRQWIGLLLFFCGCVALSSQDWSAWVAAGEKVRLATWSGMVAAGATALGTLPVLLAHSVSQRARDIMLGFGAGVMLAATAFSLVLPGLKAGAALGLAPLPASALVGAGIVLGALGLLGLDRVLPHEHFVKGREGPAASSLRRAWLFVIAITLHNLPEGLAIGVAFGGTNPVGATALGFGIAVQDVPEGLVVALALASVGYGRGAAVAIGMLSGVVEPLAAALGAALMSLSTTLLPWGLSMAAGAMLFVVSHELIPESHRQGHERWATLGLVGGFVLMMMLDTAAA